MALSKRRRGSSSGGKSKRGPGKETRSGFYEDKTKYMLVEGNPRNEISTPQFQVKLNQVVLERVEKYDYLGITLHDKLTFASHLNKLVAKTQITIYM